MVELIASQKTQKDVINKYQKRNGKKKKNLDCHHGEGTSGKGSERGKSGTKFSLHEWTLSL